MSEASAANTLERVLAALLRVGGFAASSVAELVCRGYLLGIYWYARF
mgnify:CR=1 FL=1